MEELNEYFTCLKILPVVWCYEFRFFRAKNSKKCENMIVSQELKNIDIIIMIVGNNLS